MGRFSVATLLLDRGANPRYASDSGTTALHELAITHVRSQSGGKSDYRQQIELADRLISQGVSVDAHGPQGGTPLMLAAAAGNRDLVAFLLHKGADPTTQNQRGNTALSIALKRGDAVLLSMFELKDARDRGALNEDQYLTAHNLMTQGRFEEMQTYLSTIHAGKR